MKIIKIIAILVLLLFIAGIFVTTSQLYLISGSDVVDFAYTYPFWSKIILTVLFVAISLVLLFRRFNVVAVVIGVLLFALCLVTSQAVVVSGKTNKLNAYFYGIHYGTLSYDPGVGYAGLIQQHNTGYTIIADKGSTVYLVSGFCPVCIKVK